MSKFVHSNLVSFQANLFRFAFRLTADNEDALDLLQDTNLKVLENSHRFVPESNFKGWVFTIMRNLYINQYQRSRHPLSQTDSLDSNYKRILSCADESMSPEQFFEMAEIKSAIRSLCDDYRTPFTMLIYGFRYKEISKITGFPETKVKNNIAFARRCLHSTLAAYRV